MVDYYEELNLNRSDSLDAINKTLSQLESTWKRLEINSPEKATQILAMILEARSAFKSQDAKKCMTANSLKAKWCLAVTPL